MSANESNISPEPRLPQADRAVAVLSGLRTRIRVLLVAQRVCFTLAWTIAALFALVTADYLFRFPGVMRWAFWIVGVCALIEVARRYLSPAVGFMPSLTELALRLERSGHAPRGVLAAGLELAVDRHAAPELARQAVIAASNAADANMRGIYNIARTRRSLVSALCGVVVAMTAVLALPDLSAIGIRRSLTPWATASWPKRTGVEDVLEGEAFALGRPLALRAKVTKYPGDPSKAEVKTDILVAVNGVEVYRGKVLLAYQHSAQNESSPIFERLLDVNALLPPTVRAADVVEVRYAHSTEDDGTAMRQVRMVEPPEVVDARITVEPPPYLARVTPRAELTLGDGTDDRAQAGPFFVGSRIQLTLKLNKELRIEGFGTTDFLKSAIPELAEQTGIESTSEGSTWRVTWDASNSVRLGVRLIDEFGLRNDSEHAFRIDIVADAPPSASIIDPPQDESVLAGAEVDVVGEGRDDVALDSVRLGMTIARRPKDSAGAPPEADGQERMLTQSQPNEDEKTLVRTATTLKLAELDLSEGDEVRVVSEVRDLRIAAAPDLPAVRSNVRRLRIISESAFAEQIQSDLSNVREAAKRLVKEQSAISNARGAATENVEQAREQLSRQDAVSDRLDPMSSTIRRLQSKVDRNNPEDGSIGQLLEDAANAAAEARSASRRAAEALDSLSRQDNAPQSKELGLALEQSQTLTEDRLDELVRMLERGRDGWAVRRSLERIVTEQRQLADQTGAASRDLQGRSANELSATEREDLARRAQKQQDLAQRTRAMIDNMEEQARAMEQADPGLSASMKSAAQTGRREQIAQQQEQAAKRIQENRTGSAQEDQQAAGRNLEKMLSELDRAQQRRDEALRRTAAELQDMLERLRDMQNAELTKLADKVRSGSDVKLDAGMIAINRSTADAVSKSETMSESRAVSELLRSASLAQEAAVTLLRNAEPDFAEVDANERRSLARINDAIEELNKLDEDAKQREEQRSREELAKVYAQALERQIALNVRVEPMIGKAPGRRERATLLQSGVEQEQLRAMLEEQRTKTDGMEDAKVFSYAHDRLNETMNAAATMLSNADTSMSLKRRQATAARVLGSLVQALRSDPKKDDGLRETESGDDSGGGGGASGRKGLLPPGTELKLLRMMQQEAMERTRALAEEADADASELAAVSKLQGDLHQRAAELLDAMKQPEPDESQPEVQR